MPHPVGGAMGVTWCTAVKRETPALKQSCTLTSTADSLLAWQGTQPTVLQLFLRYSVEIYKCAHASE